MGFLDQIDRDSLVCTFCGKKPVVACTASIDAEIDSTAERPARYELVENSIIATCKEHVSILQEQFEKDVEGAKAIWYAVDDD